MSHRPIGRTAVMLAVAATCCGTAIEAQAACAPIASIPFTISSSGQYCLAADLATSQTSGNAIVVNADNVVIDFQGHKLDGSGAGTGTAATGIYALERKGITVRNGLMVGFYTAIHYDMVNDTRDNLIEDMRFSQSRSRAMQVEGFNNTIRRNLVLDTMGGQNHPDGFSACEQNFNGSIQVYNNTVINVGGPLDASPDGMMLYCYNTLAIGNRVINAPDQGIGVGGGYCMDNVIFGADKPYYVEYSVPGCKQVGNTEYIIP